MSGGRGVLLLRKFSGGTDFLLGPFSRIPKPWKPVLFIPEDKGQKNRISSIPGRQNSISLNCLRRNPRPVQDGSLEEDLQLLRAANQYFFKGKAWSELSSRGRSFYR